MRFPSLLSLFGLDWFFSTFSQTRPSVRHVLILKMRFLKKLKRVAVLVAQHVTRVVKVIWSFLATQEKADDRKFLWNENRLGDGKRTIYQIKIVFFLRLHKFNLHLVILLLCLGNILPKAKPFSQIPGPLPIPFFGSQWLYSWIGPYFLDKLHLANEGKYIYDHRQVHFPMI